MSGTSTETLGMRLLIRPLMPRPRPTSRLYPGPERWILNALEANDPPRRMTKTPETTKKISFPRILLLMYHQVGPNPLRHNPRRNRTVVLAEEDPDNKAKARILLPLASTPLLLGRTRTKIKTRNTSPTLSDTLISRKAITPTSVPRKSQKTSVNLDNLYVGD